MKKIFFIIQLQLLLLLFQNCNNSTGPEDNSPSLSNLVIPQNLILTSYPYKKPRVVTPRCDSMVISFDYKGTKLLSINLDGSVDSGKSWFQITKINTGATNHADYIWTPGSNVEALKFFGEKKCVIRVSTSFDTLISGEFYIIGSRPVFLSRPVQNDHYHYNDSLPVEFTCNYDLLGDIDISFFGNDIEKKVQFSEDSARMISTVVTNTNIKSFIYYFPLLRYSAQLSEMGPTISIMISDYSSSGFYQIVTPITIDSP